MRILYFAPVEWGGAKQRPQHLARQLSEFCEFVYIQPMGLRSLKLSDGTRIVRRLKDAAKSYEFRGNLTIKTPFFLPLVNRRVDRINARLLTKQINSLITPDTIVWVTAPPGWMPDLLMRLGIHKLVYEMMDDYAEMHSKREEEILKTEAWLINRASIVVTTSSALYEKSMRINSNRKAVIVSNGVDANLFAMPLLSGKNDGRKGRKVVGCIGTLDHWIDFEMIEFLSQSRKDLDFVLVGPLRVKDVPRRSNIVFLGEKNHELMPSYCDSFDVCLIPFKKSRLTDAVNPVKLYEYFALGKPVVATRTRELLPFQDLMYLGSNKVEFLEGLDLALKEGEGGMGARRIAVAQSNDWAIKADLIKRELLKL